MRDVKIIINHKYVLKKTIISIFQYKTFFCGYYTYYYYYVLMIL